MNTSRLRGVLAALVLAGCARSSVASEGAGPADASPVREATAAPGQSGEDLLPTAVAIISLVNELRAEEGVAPLTPSAELITIAFQRSEAMVDRKYLSHTDPFDFSLPAQDLLLAQGVEGAVAENLFAAALPLDQIPEAALEAWSDSPAHRALLMDGRYEFIGVGLKGDGTWWKVTQILAESLP